MCFEIFFAALIILMLFFLVLIIIYQMILPILPESALMFLSLRINNPLEIYISYIEEDEKVNKDYLRKTTREIENLGFSHTADYFYNLNAIMASYLRVFNNSNNDLAIIHINSGLNKFDIDYIEFKTVYVDGNEISTGNCQHPPWFLNTPKSKKYKCYTKISSIAEIYDKHKKASEKYNRKSSSANILNYGEHYRKDIQLALEKEVKDGNMRLTKDGNQYMLTAQGGMALFWKQLLFKYYGFG